MYQFMSVVLSGSLCLEKKSLTIRLCRQLCCTTRLSISTCHCSLETNYL